MRLAKMVLAGSLLMMVSSVTMAQQALTGTVTIVNRISGTITIQPTQSGPQAQGGTVDANTAGAAEQFKVQTSMLNTVHAGDRVTFSVSEAGGTKTITKLEKQ